ncbi:MAG: tRNA pseudouridine(55) synthase TruB [PVC group bacterium]|nr:tRNA pseudouridine(55) synthase TruB [PVC group bacterium]
MDINGILLIDKPSGVTSHDMVFQIRKRLQVKKVGHAGTLDPAATGLLILLIGKATKLSASFLGLDKKYEVKLTLGVTTKTADHTGEILKKKEVPEFLQEQIEQVLGRFIGSIEQIPPMVSAKKIGGKKLYVLARKGIEIERKPQKINIYNIELKEINLPDVYFSVHCSKGTYIRTLCEDVGEVLSCGGHMSALRRTACGEYKVEDALDGSILRDIPREKIEQRIIG